MTITDSTIRQNTADGNGGGIFNRSRTADDVATIERSEITGNVASGGAGGGILSADGSQITGVDVTYRNNSPDDCNGC